LANHLSRLTLVAFVFIPLNFATSFFGMNVQQLGTGSMHIGFFFLTAALAGGLGILLSTIIKPLQVRISRARQDVASSEYMELEEVSKRDILRRSKVGHKLINAMTLTDDDGNTRFEGPPEFRAVFTSWCIFKLQHLWGMIRRIKVTPQGDDDHVH